jgi:cytochrome oxidase Cu insertion factor (SCO1/SenC/PrrC family)
MTNETPPGLTEEDRLAAYRQELAATSRHGGRAYRPSVPPRSVLVVAAVFVVLGLGGTVLDHFVGGAGGPSSTSTVGASVTTTSLATTVVNASTRAFIGLKEIASAVAPSLELRDQSGRAWNLSDARGHVILLAFFAKGCTDICPVLGTELRDVLVLLARRKISADVAIVNTDPHDLAWTADPAALTVPGLVARPNVQFLTGTLAQLNATWVNYGISISVGSKANEITHNNVLYFIDPRGELRALAIPFAHESRGARFTLSVANERRFAQGVAAEASSLAR